MTIATSSREKARRDWGRRLVILIPALWLTIFFLAPCLIVLKISLSQTTIAQPPYLPVLDLAAGWPGIKDFIAGLSFDNYKILGSDWLYLTSYLRSLTDASVEQWTSKLMFVGEAAVGKTSLRKALCGEIHRHVARALEDMKALAGTSGCIKAAAVPVRMLSAECLTKWGNGSTSSPPGTAAAL